MIDSTFLQKGSIDLVNWKDVSKQVEKVNSKLFKIIEKIKPSLRYPFVRVRYPYGMKIVNEGTFPLFNDSHVSESIKQSLNYSPIPLGLVLNNMSEIFVELNHRPIPLKSLLPGDFLGVFELTDMLRGKIPTPPLWSLTAGARTLFMIPKITDSTGHLRIQREFKIQQPIPSDLSQHWSVFKEIAQKSSQTHAWYNEVIYFTQSWFDTSHTDIHWSNLYHYFYHLGLSKFDALRFRTKLHLLWESLSPAFTAKKIKSKPYLTETAKHLICIANGSALGFRPASDETSGPIAFLQQVYTDTYRLKNHFPTLMYPASLHSSSTPCYYSLSYPTTFEIPRFNKFPPNIIKDQLKLKNLIHTFQVLFANLAHPLQDKEIYLLLKKTSYEFFHSDLGNSDEIQGPSKILKKDPYFLHSSHTHLRDRTFCSKAQFWRGCIRISGEG